jgi:hypothetical protein
MRTFLKALLLIAGAVLILWGLKPLGLLFFGDTGDGVITQIVGSKVKTEMKWARRSASKPTGFFKIDTKVRYRFDVNPTPLEELKRLSRAPLARDVEGLDTLYGKTRFPDSPMYREDDRIRVIFFKPWPSYNAAYQPRSMRTLAALRLGAGAMVFVGGLIMLLRKRRGARQAKSTF